ncbi:MAG: PIG-L deacetylase family protein [archaeon]
MAQNILIIGAHSDDQIIGVGGTAAKYAEEGFQVTTVIVSQGEGSHPHFRENIIMDTREKESIHANKVIGGKAVKFLRILEKDFNKEKELKKARRKLRNLIIRLKPVKIFVHSPEDHHPVHKKVNKMTLDILNELNWNKEVYSFDIWNTFKWNKKHPRLIVDISSTFDKKMRALRAFKSQFTIQGFLNYLPLIAMYIKNVKNGRTHGSKYAEVFYRIR